MPQKKRNGKRCSPKTPAFPKLLRIAELGEPKPISWVWEGFAAHSECTLLAGRWKSGKTTLLGLLLKAMEGEAGGELGTRVYPGRYVVISEEHAGLWARRAKQLGLSQGFLCCQPFCGRRCTLGDWVKLWISLADVVERNHIDCVILDTLARLAPPFEENSASAVADVLAPLEYVAAAGVAVIVVHHTRKSGGARDLSFRGSGQLGAWPTFLVQFQRKSEKREDRRRKLLCDSRVSDSLEVQIALAKDMRSYERVRTQPEILAAVIGSERISLRDIWQRWPVNGSAAKPTIRTIQRLISAQPDVSAIGKGRNRVYMRAPGGASY